MDGGTSLWLSVLYYVAARYTIRDLRESDRYMDPLAQS